MDIKRKNSHAEKLTLCPKSVRNSQVMLDIIFT
jgi:hypothetical protein